MTVAWYALVTHCADIIDSIASYCIRFLSTVSAQTEADVEYLRNANDSLMEANAKLQSTTRAKIQAMERQLKEKDAEIAAARRCGSQCARLFATSITDTDTELGRPFSASGISSPYSKCPTAAVLQYPSLPVNSSRAIARRAPGCAEPHSYSLRSIC